MASQALATSTDFGRFGISSKAVARVASPDLDAVLGAVSSEAAGSLIAAGYVMPLVSWGDDLRLAVCKIAAWEILSGVVGMNPEDPASMNPKLRADEARAWLRAVAKHEIVPDAIVDSSTQVPKPAGMYAFSEPRRGW